MRETKEYSTDVPLTGDALIEVFRDVALAEYDLSLLKVDGFNLKIEPFLTDPSDGEPIYAHRKEIPRDTLLSIGEVAADRFFYERKVADYEAKIRILQLNLFEVIARNEGVFLKIKPISEEPTPQIYTRTVIPRVRDRLNERVNDQTRGGIVGQLRTSTGNDTLVLIPDGKLRRRQLSNFRVTVIGQKLQPTVDIEVVDGF